MVALVIPYAIVELMRVYAWLSIIDNEGPLNRLFDRVGLIDLEAPIRCCAAWTATVWWAVSARRCRSRRSWRRSRSCSGRRVRCC